MRYTLFHGMTYPIGATVFPDGVNFCLWSKNATAVELLLFENTESLYPSTVIHFDPKVNKTFYYWHIFIKGLQAGQVYAYRVYGPSDVAIGHHFDGAKVLIDPYSRAVVLNHHYDREAAKLPGDNCPNAMRSVVIDHNDYDWTDDVLLRHEYSHTTIYEMHVAGFTKHESSGVAPEKRGTYAGLIEKIPYLKELGITAVELLPVQQFDPYDAPKGKTNYWGYSPIAFFAPHAAYASTTDPIGAVKEFKDMVKALHRAGIEVILDVVFNHTAEGDHTGPTLCYRGIENRAYYMLENNKYFYKNYSGCGNTIHANHSVVRKMILDCLRSWVIEYHIDGFRFDLASVLARDEYGTPLENPPILWEIESDPVLAGTKIIAEAWDAGGLYQVGSFIGDRWAEWNGRFRDDIRRFIKGDTNTVWTLSERISGSSDVFLKKMRDPNRSINFITCHDGFTLNDLVSYNYKHNEANGEDNRDGNNDNHSWNCGVEGPTDFPEIEATRIRQIKNAFCILFLSQGTPMILMGDEVRHTQQGNNNAYCQDNELSWFDWRNLEKHAEIYLFVKNLIAFSDRHEVFQEKRFWIKSEKSSSAHVRWHGTRLGQPDFGEHSHSLAYELLHPDTDGHIMVMLNAYWESIVFEVPPIPRAEDKKWRKIIDTALPSPDDFIDSPEAPLVTDGRCTVKERSVVVLVAR
jgi:glycogen operon protein